MGSGVEQKTSRQIVDLLPTGEELNSSCRLVPADMYLWNNNWI